MQAQNLVIDGLVMADRGSCSKNERRVGTFGVEIAIGDRAKDSIPIPTL
jgi:hypothetical protein